MNLPLSVSSTSLGPMMRFCRLPELYPRDLGDGSALAYCPIRIMMATRTNMDIICRGSISNVDVCCRLHHVEWMVGDR